ncbi:GtrA family protein [Erwinia tracheiphila]|uniref:Bactoprenol-linked glucose translocase n=1 Tax=Erwinia tracheiphila TaxID=65700 RepID=A0A0M2KD87_9GAMM|nr:GtrA family protein [Erwinia tracheiphila]AXF76602.1 GtrA family protein [Erwinia tracheiphila]EOS96129.1 bactoprenol-linked glucose translocase [Erwinia tracheiphila PSU-1]KKF35282.1 translocase [Erwinia tracheiphila]UIA84726.1 GtrA family protein [Erwinia tracheiphila]UIA86946.1 GtrA family protein [Erwinia tracheiphila]
MLKLFARYSFIGVFNTLIHWLVFSLLYSQEVSQSLANLVAFCIAVTFSFFANARWTFNTEATTIRYGLYVFFMGSMAAGIGKLADHAHINPVIMLIAFSVLSLAFGFIYSNFIVFREKK